MLKSVNGNLNWQAQLRPVEQIMQSPSSVQFKNRLSKQSQPTPKFPHRKYHRLSQFAPDQDFVINYLKQRGYSKTASCFETEIRSTQNKDSIVQTEDQLIRKNKILTMFDSGKADYDVLLRDLNIVCPSMKDSQQTFALKLKFYLHVWSIAKSTQKTQKEERNKQFKKFIQKYGQKLTQDDELLPYFAISYIPNPETHPFLKAIYSKEWHQKVKKMLKEILSQKTSGKSAVVNETAPDQRQKEWYLFFSDLVRISSKICEMLPKGKFKEKQTSEMIGKIREYERVLKENEVQLSSLNSSHNRAVYSEESVSQLQKTSKFIEQLEGILEKQPHFMSGNLNKAKLDINVVEGVNHQDLDLNSMKIQLFSIFANPNRSQAQTTKVIEIMSFLRMYINSLASSKRKLFIYSLVNNDILSIQKVRVRSNSGKKIRSSREKQQMPNECELIIMGLGTEDDRLLLGFLSFLNKIASFYAGRSYLIDNALEVILPICNGMLKSMVFDHLPINHDQQNESELYQYNHNSERKSHKHQEFSQSDKTELNLLLSLLYKLSARELVVEHLIRGGTMRIVDIILSNFGIVEKDTITFTLAILELMIGQKSNKESLQTAIFQTITKILSTIAQQTPLQEMHLYQELESHLHATLYLFLQMDQYREKAQKIGLKNTLMTNMMARNQDGYTKQVQHIIRRIDYGLSNVEGVREVELGQDHQQSDEGSQQQIERSSFLDTIQGQVKEPQSAKQCMDFLRNYEKRQSSRQSFTKNREGQSKQNLLSLKKIIPTEPQKSSIQNQNYILESAIHKRPRNQELHRQNKSQVLTGYKKDNYEWRKVKK